MSSENRGQTFRGLRTPRDANDFPPEDDIGSRGSSVSADFVDEYNQLLQYAVVLPTLTGANAQTPVAKVTNQSPAKTSPPRSNPIGAPREVTESLKSPPSAVSPAASSVSDVRSNVSLASIRRSPRSGRHVGESGTSDATGFDMFDMMAQQMKKAARQELLQQILIEQEKSQAQLERQRQAFAKEMQQMLGTLSSAQQEMEKLKEECARKDNAVQAVLHNLAKQRSELLATRAFYRWKDRLKDRKLENYENRLADRQYEVNMLKRSVQAWKTGTKNQWRDRVKLNCQSHAEHVCHVLAEKYELKLKELKSELEARETENEALRHQREEFQDRMKEAFMRGVCALNLEAMKVLSPSSSKANSQTALPSTSGPTHPKPSQRALFRDDDLLPRRQDDPIVLEDATEDHHFQTVSSPRCRSGQTNVSSGISDGDFPVPSGRLRSPEGGAVAPPGQSMPRLVYPIAIGGSKAAFRSVARDADSLGEHSTDDVSSDMSAFSHKDLMYSYNERCRIKESALAARAEQGRNMASPPRIISAPRPKTIPVYAHGVEPEAPSIKNIAATANRPKLLLNTLKSSKPMFTGGTTGSASNAVQVTAPATTTLYKASKSLLKPTNKVQQQTTVVPVRKPAVSASIHASGTANNFHVHRHHYPQSLAGSRHATTAIKSSSALRPTSSQVATCPGSNSSDASLDISPKPPVTTASSYNSASYSANSTNYRNVGDGQDSRLQTSQVLKHRHANRTVASRQRTGETKGHLIGHRLGDAT